MRLALLIPIFAFALQADPVTVVETSSGVGVTGSSYFYNVPTSAGLVTALIRGDANCNFSCSNDQQATAAIDFAMDMYTDGPIRDGIAVLQLVITQGPAVEGGGRVSGAIGPYSLGSCLAELTCLLDGYFPFELGVPFTIDLSGFADGYPGGDGFNASASLQLFELPTQTSDPAGAPVQIYLVPEPGSAGLAFTGLSALALHAFRRRRNLPSI